MGIGFRAQLLSAPWSRWERPIITGRKVRRRGLQKRHAGTPHVQWIDHHPHPACDRLQRAEESKSSRQGVQG